jgi:hypothetical protein
VRRKAANRTEPLYLRRGTRQRQLPSYFASPPPQDEDVPAVARKKPRLEESLPTTTDKAARKTALPDVSIGLSLPAAADDDDVNADADADAVSDTKPNAVATGSWTLVEDAKLTIAVANTSKKRRSKEYKTDWVAITELVPGRTQKQCYDRWRNGLDSSSISRATGSEGNGQKMKTAN